METAEPPVRKEIYTYKAPWTTYGLGWSHKDPQNKFRLAVGSFKEEYSNQIHIVELKREDGESNPQQTEFTKLADVEHPYPATKLAWAPAAVVSHTDDDILATAGDYLRLWKVDGDGGNTKMKSLLNNNRHTEYCAPLTSFDWNETDPNIIGTSSVDTTCTIWDVNKLTPKTQLIAHDKEVYDIAFAKNSADIFGTVGADGSLRIFDLRSLEHSTIMYESDDLTPLLRLSWNRQDPNYIATILTASSKAVILDIRSPSVPVTELSGHQACLNSVCWAPHSSRHIATGSDDKQAFIWDTTPRPRVVEEPILAYMAESEVNSLVWDYSYEGWISVCHNDCMQILKV